MHTFQLKVFKSGIWTARARKDFLILIEKTMTIRFAGLTGARNEFCQKMMSVMWLQRRDVTWVFRAPATRDVTAAPWCDLSRVLVYIDRIFTAATRLTTARTDHLLKVHCRNSWSRSKSPQCWPHFRPMFDYLSQNITNSFLLICNFHTLLGPIFPLIWPMLGPVRVIGNHVGPFFAYVGPMFGLSWAMLAHLEPSSKRWIDPRSPLWPQKPHNPGSYALPTHKTVQYLARFLAFLCVFPIFFTFLWFPTSNCA